jgi:hypothetical protein
LALPLAAQVTEQHSAEIALLLDLQQWAAAVALQELVMLGTGLPVAVAAAAQALYLWVILHLRQH